MRYFFDTEFYDDGTILHPISIGMVNDAGNEIYLEYEFDINSSKKLIDLFELKIS